MERLNQKLLEGDLDRILAAVEEVIDDNRHYRELIKAREYAPDALIGLLNEDLAGLVQLKRDVEKFREAWLAEVAHV